MLYLGCPSKSYSVSYSEGTRSRHVSTGWFGVILVWHNLVGTTFICPYTVVRVFILALLAYQGL